MTTINYAAALPVLRAGRQRVERGWCQGWCAKNDAGEFRMPWESDATQVCVRGALGFPFESKGARDAEDVLGECAEPLVALWNDAPGRTQDEVLDLFDAAIRKCEESISHSSAH
jgi:hypothetical protein